MPSPALLARPCFPTFHPYQEFMRYSCLKHTSFPNQLGTHEDRELAVRDSRPPAEWDRDERAVPKLPVWAQPWLDLSSRQLEVEPEELSGALAQPHSPPWELSCAVF